jgi:nitroreductase
MISKKLACIAFLGLLSAGADSRLPIPKKRIGRTAQYAGMDPLFIERWSPRAMSAEPLEESQLMSLFEAARWAPSSYNEQPWRFLYALRDTPHWDTFFDLLVPFNQGWCKNGAVLVVICSKNGSDHGGSNTFHSYDAGAAWQNLALQGHLKGLVVHGMGGFDKEKARLTLQIPDEYTIEAMCVIGKPGDPKNLPNYMQDIEKPSARKNMEEIVCQGRFGFKE